jgi:diacylglycerol kinase family enzyme
VLPREISVKPEAKKIVVLVNRRARNLVGDTRSSRALLATLHAPRVGVCVYETRGVSELDDIVTKLAREVPDSVFLAGGDGTYMACVTSLVRAFQREHLSPERWPSIGLIPGGTACTVTRNWTTWSGRKTADYTERLLLGRSTSVPRATLCVRDDHEERTGFIVGAGLVSRFFDVYESEGAGGYRGAASIVARVFVSSLLRGAFAERVLSPVPCAVALDGERIPMEALSLLCASVVRDVGLGLRLLYRAGERRDRFHVVASSLPAARLGPQLPLVLAGRPLLSASGAGVDALARSFAIHFGDTPGAYVLDGEILRSCGVTVTPGPTLHVLRGDG